MGQIRYIIDACHEKIDLFRVPNFGNFWYFKIASNFFYLNHAGKFGIKITFSVDMFESHDRSCITQF